MKTIAIIVAAGRGSRAGSGAGAKQYREIGDRTMLAHAVAPFIEHNDVDHVQVAIHEDDREAALAAFDTSSGSGNATNAMLNFMVSPGSNSLKPPVATSMR